MPSYTNKYKAEKYWEENLKFEEFQRIMNSCVFKEIIVFKNFELENGVLGLDRDCYLRFVEFLDSSILRKV
jgi:hypothetical protein